MNSIKSIPQGQAASRNITTGQNFLFWSLHSLESNCYQNKSTRFEDRLSAESPYSKRALLEESMINVACVFKVLQSCGADAACRKVVTRFFIKRTVFLSRSLCCGSQKQQVRDAQMGLHNCNTFRNKTLTTNSNKFIHIVTLRHNRHSMNSKIIPEELFPEMAKYTLPFNNSLKPA